MLYSIVIDPESEKIKPSWGRALRKIGNVVQVDAVRDPVEIPALLSHVTVYASGVVLLVGPNSEERKVREFAFTVPSVVLKLSEPATSVRLPFALERLIQDNVLKIKPLIALEDIRVGVRESTSRTLETVKGEASRADVRMEEVVIVSAWPYNVAIEVEKYIVQNHPVVVLLASSEAEITRIASQLAKRGIRTYVPVNVPDLVEFLQANPFASVLYTSRMELERWKQALGELGYGLDERGVADVSQFGLSAQ